MRQFNRGSAAEVYNAFASKIICCAQKKENCSPHLPPLQQQQFNLLTFGMIPHITQERRAENNIHHTGRIEGTVRDAEKM